MFKKILAAMLLLIPLGLLAAVIHVGGRQFTVTTPATIVDTSNLTFPITVSIYPQSGVTGSVEYSNTPNAASSPSAANWQQLGAASGVTSSSPMTITAPSAFEALRLARQSGASAVIAEINWNY